MVLIQQYNLETDLKLFGDKGEKAVANILSQIQDMEDVIPMDNTKL